MTQDLIERLEKAEAGSRELDRDIAIALVQHPDKPSFLMEGTADAVEWHYWMFTSDTGPLVIRRIEHEGE